MTDFNRREFLMSIPALGLALGQTTKLTSSSTNTLIKTYFTVPFETGIWGAYAYPVDRRGNLTVRLLSVMRDGFELCLRQTTVHGPVEGAVCCAFDTPYRAEAGELLVIDASLDEVPEDQGLVLSSADGLARLPIECGGDGDQR